MTTKLEPVKCKCGRAGVHHEVAGEHWVECASALCWIGRPYSSRYWAIKAWNSVMNPKGKQ